MRNRLKLLLLGGVGVLTACGLGLVTSAPSQTAPFDLPSRSTTALDPVSARATSTARPAQTPKPQAATADTPAPAYDLVAVTSPDDQKVVLVNPASGEATRTIGFGAPVGNIALAPDGRSAWVFSTKPTESDFFRVDLIKGERQDGKRLRDGPQVATFSSDGRRAYVALAGGNDSPPGPSTIVFLDTSRRDEFGHIDVGRQTPGVQIRRRLVALTVAPGAAGDVLYAAGRDSGTVWALDGGSGQSLAEIEVGGAPLALLPDASRHAVYVLVEGLNQLDVVDTASQEITSRVDLPGRPSAAALAPDGSLYITDADAGELWHVVPALGRTQTRLPVGRDPQGVAVGLDGAHVYVLNRAEGKLSVVDVAAGHVIATLPVAKNPMSVIVAPQVSPDATPVATEAPVAQPTATPSLVPTPTPLPQGALPPEHLPAGVVSEPFVPHAEFPVAMAFASDGRLFYNELKTGKIRVVQNGSLLPDPFYQFKVAGQPETGLIGLTLDPDFAHNHYLYVFYTSVPDGQENGGTNGPNRVVRLTDLDNKGIDPTPILPDLPSGPIHNGGGLRFGPDGKLYVSIGDNDQGSNAQDLGSLAGKILRINPDGSIPDDNPFVGQAGKQAAVWAAGLRNPYSFDFHPISHGMLATVNGPGDNDELDLIQKGANYGWPPSGYKNKPGIVDPIAVMNPPIGPTGTTFYMGDQVPEWKNDWFYCNFHQGQLRRVRLAPGTFDRIVFEEVVKQGCLLGTATGPDGALYYADAKGIWRLRPETAPGLPTVADGAPAAAVASSTATPAPLPEGTRAEDRDLNLSVSEWSMSPSRTRVPAGQIRFLAENVGATQHALQIVGQGGLDVSTDAFGPGQSRSLTITLAAGTYQLICPVPGHAQQGMTATLSVVGP